MIEFCLEIMELADALVAEDGLITSAISKALSNSEDDTMSIRSLQTSSGVHMYHCSS
jgi:hypothetical protein